MPTGSKKAKRTNINNRSGFFERFGRKIDRGVLWIGEQTDHIRTTYGSLNDDYVKRIQNGKLLRVLPPSLVLLVILFMFAPFFIVQVFSHNTVTLQDNSGALFPYGEMYTGEVEQELVPGAGWNDVSSIGVFFGTFARQNDADYEFLLKKDGEIIYSQLFSALDLGDNQYYQFQLDEPLDFNEGDDYSFLIRAIRTTENDVITLYHNIDTDDIVYNVESKTRFQPFIIVSLIIFVVIFAILNVLVNSGKIKSDFQFLAYMLLYIIPVAFIYPVYTIPDEPYHFLSALRLAEYDWSKSPSFNLSRAELNLPENSGCLASYLHNIHASTPDMITDCFQSAASATGEYVGAGTTSRAIAYIPSALGIMLGDLISNSPMVIFYCGRVLNLLAVGAIIALSLSLVKKHRMVLLAVIFIPMFLQQAISYSYDGILNALCILIVSYGIRFLTTDVKVRKRDVAIMVSAVALIGLIKLPYVMVAAPLLFVKSEKFGKHKVAKWLVGISLLIAMLVPYILSVRIEAIGSPNNLVNDSYDSVVTDRGFPLESIISQPRATVKMFLRTLKEKGFFYIYSTIGYFGWFYFSLDPVIIAIYLIFLLVVVLSEHEEKITGAMRVWIASVMVVLIGSFFLVMYLQWTPRSSNTIDGVQGRYFLPAIPLLMLVVMPKKRRLNIPRETYYSFFGLYMLCFVVTLLTGFY